MSSYYLRFFFFGFLILFDSFSQAASFSPSAWTNPSNILSASVMNPIIMGIGTTFEHRPYEGASPLNRGLGLDIGIELTVVKVSEKLNGALASVTGSNSSLTILPSARLHVRKGLGDKITVGVSLLIYKDYKFYGADIKYTFYKEGEGPSWAFRLNYATAAIKSFLFTTSIRPEFVVSRRLDFAEPYIFAGYESISGKLDLTFTIGPTSIPLKATGSGGAGVAGLGNSFQFGPLPVILCIEGSYSSFGSHTLGAKFGVTF